MARIYIEKEISSNIVMRESYSDLESALGDFIEQKIGSTINLEEVKTYKEFESIFQLTKAGYRFSSQTMAVFQDSIQIFALTKIVNCQVFPGTYEKKCFDLIGEFQDCKSCLLTTDFDIDRQNPKDNLFTEDNLFLIIVTGESKPKEDLLCFKSLPGVANIYATC
jgi:hypothetical protein